MRKLKDFYINHKKKIFTTLRIVISLGLIAYLIIFRSGFKNFNDFINILSNIKMIYLASAIAMHVAGIWLSTYRWQILLKTQNIIIPQGFLISSFLIGSFFNNILPTSIGGDIFRAIDISKKAEVTIGKSASVILIDRFSGIITAAIYAVIALFLGFATVGKTSYIIPVSIFFVLCIIIGFLVLNPSILRLDKLINRVKFLSKIREKLHEIYNTFQSFKKYKLALVEAMLFSFALQLAVIASYYFAAKSVNIELSFASFIFIVPIVSIISFLPISIGGAGLRENSTVLLMVALGAAKSQSTVCSLIIFAIIMGMGIIGAIVYIIRPFILRQKQIS